MLKFVLHPRPLPKMLTKSAYSIQFSSALYVSPHVTIREPIFMKYYSLESFTKKCVGTMQSLVKV